MMMTLLDDDDDDDDDDPSSNSKRRRATTATITKRRNSSSSSSRNLSIVCIVSMVVVACLVMRNLLLSISLPSNYYEATASMDRPFDHDIANHNETQQQPHQQLLSTTRTTKKELTTTARDIATTPEDAAGYPTTPLLSNNTTTTKVLSKEETESTEQQQHEHVIQRNTTTALSNNNKALLSKQETSSERSRWKRLSQLIPTTSTTDIQTTLLKVPTPIFVASLPKSGTTSVWKYFTCGGIRSSHLTVKLNETERQRFDTDTTNNENTSSVILAGRCMKRNVVENKPLLQQCGNYQVWTDHGFIKGKPATSCFYPAIHGLEALYQDYPKATLLLLTRQTSEWRRSVSQWSMGTLLKRWYRCQLWTGFSTTTTTPKNKTLAAEAVEAFYEWHTLRVRKFAQTHPSLTYIEAELESPDTGRYLEDVTGISSSCWADCNPGKRTCAAQRTNTNEVS